MTCSISRSLEALFKPKHTMNPIEAKVIASNAIIAIETKYIEMISEITTREI
jgi:hypothetical protein